jgi:hypothetical protein
MSGGPLIDLGDFSTPKNVQKGKKAVGQLAGLLIEYHPTQKAIVAVRIDVVLSKF